MNGPYRRCLKQFLIWHQKLRSREQYMPMLNQAFPFYAVLYVHRMMPVSSTVILPPQLILFIQFLPGICRALFPRWLLILLIWLSEHKSYYSFFGYDSLRFFQWREPAERYLRFLCVISNQYIQIILLKAKGLVWTV